MKDLNYQGIDFFQSDAKIVDAKIAQHVTYYISLSALLKI